MNLQNMDVALRIFIVGFSGVFLNLAFLMGAVKLFGFMIRRSEQRQKNKTGGAAPESGETKAA